MRGNREVNAGKRDACPTWGDLQPASLHGYTFRMRKAPRNPFYIVLGLVGFLFTITAASSCLTVLRGARLETARAPKSPLETFMDRHGTTLMTGQLAVLALATVGAVALDEYRGRKQPRNAPRDEQP